MTADNRAHPRFTTSLKGRLLSIDGRCNFACTILDLSEGGARINTREHVLVPSRIFLHVATTGAIFDCEVRWSRANEIGFRFLDSPGKVCRKALLNLCQRQLA